MKMVKLKSFEERGNIQYGGLVDKLAGQTIGISNTRNSGGQYTILYPKGHTHQVVTDDWFTIPKEDLFDTLYRRMTTTAEDKSNTL